MTKRKPATSTFWLMKTEPDEFSIDTLRAKHVARWDGVRNYQARNHLRAMQLGDRAFIYHSSCAVPGIAGLGAIAASAYPDPSQFDPASQYHDPKSPLDEPRWSAVDVRFVRAFPALVSLATLHEQPDLAGLLVLQRGSRLSVVPVSPAHAAVIMRLAGG